MSKTQINRPLSIFLCHSSEDKPAVRMLYRDLRKNGFNPWLDEEKLIPGQDWDLEISKTEKEADIIIICLSKQSVRKEGYVQKEIKFALDIADEKPEGTIFVIPARLEMCSIPYKLSHLHCVDLFLLKGYSKLQSALRARAYALNLSPNIKLNDELAEKKPPKLDKKISINKKEDNQTTLQKPFDDSSLLGLLFSAIFLFGGMYLQYYFLVYLMHRFGLVDITQMGALSSMDIGAVSLIALLLSQASALFFVFETYGISKLTGSRYRVSAIKTLRIMAWIAIITGSIGWGSIGLLGINSNGLLTFPLGQSFSFVLESLFTITPIISVMLVESLFFAEGSLFLPMIITKSLVNKKINEAK